MKSISVSTLTATLTVALMTIAMGCTRNESNTSDPKVHTQSQTDQDSAKSDSSDAAKTPVTSASEVVASPVAEQCPGEIIKDEVIEKYKKLGVTIEIDCEGIKTSRYFNYHSMADLKETLMVLDRTYELFKDWSNRPNVIRFGERPFHSSKLNLIQVPYIPARPKDLEDYLRDTRWLMDLEVTDFNRDVRFSYVDYNLGQQPNGSRYELGAGALIGYGAAREQIVKDDIAKIRRLKMSIAKMPYRNVRITHANQMGSFLVSQFSDAYTLPVEYSEAQLNSYFQYLTKLGDTQKKFGAIDISVIIPSYPDLRIDLASKALDIILGSKSAIQNLGVKAVGVKDSDITALTNRFQVSIRGSLLEIKNLYGNDGKFQTSKQLSDCLNNPSLAATKQYYCDGEGYSRY